MVFTVDSPSVTYSDDFIESDYTYQTTKVQKEGNGRVKVLPVSTQVTIRTARHKPRLGCMLVGWGGNNGTTVTASLIANQMAMSWHTKEGVQHANFYGSLTQASTLSLGHDDDGEFFIPFKDILPMVEPADIVLDGWDISSMNLADAMERAQVLDYSLQQKLRPYMKSLKPRPSIYLPSFIAANQQDRADNVLSGSKEEMVEKIRKDIRDFKTSQKLDKVIVLWTANTERFCSVEPGLNTSAKELLDSITRDQKEISPSTLFAVASILEGCAYINGSPQNTFVPGMVDLATQKGVMIAGDDFKSGQTKLKSVLVDFLVSAGIKISKSNVVDDMVQSNPILYKKNESPDHCVVIKYVPYVADSKRALDEYTSEIMMGGRNTIVIHNTCEDSLLASPIILDLVILTEICQRISFRIEGEEDFQTFDPVLSILSYLCKAPMVPQGTPVVNALFKQRACIENIFRACVGLPPQSHMTLQDKCPALRHHQKKVTTATQSLAKDCKSRVANGGPVLVTNGHPHLTNGMANGHCNGSK